MALGLQSLRCAGESPTNTDAATTDAAREDRGPAFGLPDAGPACAPRLGTVYACGTTVVGFPCGMPEGLRDGYLSESACSEICEGLFGESRENPFTCRLQPPLRGTTGALHCVRSCLPDGGPIPRDTGIGWEPIDGRRPEGFQGRSRAYATETVSEYLLAAAEMEAASVAAFARLALELAAHGAPDDLVRRARQSQRDERNHTRAVAGLAARYHATFAPPRTVVGPVRSLAEVATENVVEGCVRETYAALQAEWQGRHAHDPSVRAAYRRIAVDEARHASLAWDVARWLAPRLSAAELEHLEVARAEAIHALCLDRRVSPPPHLAGPLGLPSAAMALRLLAGLDDALWSQPVAA